ncbi:glycoside hydrolase family 3 protein [Vibrio tapetis subsp. quintayensis]|uniref:glycoside hydrolase family 3 protein n=1 Tax=Vibrio tapetis TaxID=52443 RepID=UPI0025B45E1D|nr:glycoside hydrolase family 3 protein [Vibrio tapetis]MDN3681099.1 glycoside hydrolase family 3 protein [Vibrio tapetis subsp. quintayensis]
METCPYFADWPKIQTQKDPKIEQLIATILAQMTLEEKVGQMIQPNLRDVTPEEAREYKLGSILNGGGAWPNENKHASAKCWANKADEFWLAVEEAYIDRPFRIPFMWATDAVHGHNNVFGATVFPHNIGLGAARDNELIRKIGEITAKEIVATGLDWTFAPTVATPRNLRWGRVYEGYSEDPTITYHYAQQMVLGLQGNSQELKTDLKVLSNVKHWLGDGGTVNGVDRGVNGYSEELLRNIHGPGYFSGLQAGAQVVMSSFNSWRDEANYDHTTNGVEYNQKIHGSKYLLNDVLKQHMGYDGVVVTDWHGHAEVSKCSDGDASYAINAGNDVLMVPVREHWKSVWKQTLEDVNRGIISAERIDDAVTRILRIKARAGLWDKPQPSQRRLAGNSNILGADEHRMVAREAVRKSLVLLKNDNNILPLAANQKVWLTGSAADDLQKQAGGWNLTWQGDENSVSDFPGATTLKMALEQEMPNLDFDPEQRGEYAAGDIAIVAFGEDPYAEMMGDIKTWQSLEYSSLKRSYSNDCAIIDKLHSQGVKVISVFFSGRPLYLNKEIGLSEAFVAAWLPGSEGLGITDVLVGEAVTEKGLSSCDSDSDLQVKPRVDFQGKLSFSWPNKMRSDAVNARPSHVPNYVLPEQEQDPEGEHKPLFELGYGLTYKDDVFVNVELDQDEFCDHQQNKPLELYGIRANVGDYQLRVRDAEHIMGVDVSRNNPVILSSVDTFPYNYQQQQDAIRWICRDGGGELYLNSTDGSTDNLSGFSKGLKFDIRIISLSDSAICVGISELSDLSIDISPYLDADLIGSDEFQTIDIPISEFSEQDLRYIDTPLILGCVGDLECVIGNVSWY